MIDSKKGEVPPDLIEEVIKGLLNANFVLQNLPFDGAPGTPLSYPKSKKPDPEDPA